MYASGPAGVRISPVASTSGANAAGGGEHGHVELAEIGRMRTVVERLESRMGRSNPQVGKAWLSLARMYQHVGGPAGGAAAAEALTRALAVSRTFSAEFAVELPVQFAESFAYLIDRVQPAGPAGQQRDADRRAEGAGGAGPSHQSVGAGEAAAVPSQRLAEQPSGGPGCAAEPDVAMLDLQLDLNKAPDLATSVPQTAAA
jgi:hypothetical protein